MSRSSCQRRHRVALPKLRTAADASSRSDGCDLDGCARCFVQAAQAFQCDFVRDSAFVRHELAKEELNVGGRALRGSETTRLGPDVVRLSPTAHRLSQLQSACSSSSRASKGRTRTCTLPWCSSTCSRLPDSRANTSSDWRSGSTSQACADAFACVDAQLLAAIDGFGRRRQHLANPIRRERQVRLVWRRRESLASPTGEVRHEHVVAEVQLRLDVE